MKIDEETFGTNDAVRMMFKIASDNNLSSEKRMINRRIGLRNLINRPFQSAVVSRLVAWLKFLDYNDERVNVVLFPLLPCT